MDDDDRRRVEEARARGLDRAREFFESLTDGQRARMESASCPTGGPSRDDLEAAAGFYEEVGWSSRADYLAREEVIARFQAGGPATDADLDRMLGSLADTDASVVRARVLAYLHAVITRDRPGPDLLARVEAAIAPFRRGPEDLDVMYWGLVRKAIDALKPAPPG